MPQHAVLSNDGLQVVPDLPSLFTVLPRGRSHVHGVAAESRAIEHRQLAADLVEEKRNVIDKNRLRQSGRR